MDSEAQRLKYLCSLAHVVSFSSSNLASFYMNRAKELSAGQATRKLCAASPLSGSPKANGSFFFLL